MIESVAVRQRGAYDFETHYNNLCALQSTCPLPAVKAHLPERALDLNGDRIRSLDWLPILGSLKINKTLEFIAFRSYYQQTLDEHEGRGYKRKTPAIRSKEISYTLCKALKECLSVTPVLTVLEMQGLPLRERDLAALAKGLHLNRTVQHLSFEHSKIQDEGLEIVAKGIKNALSISTLDFTGCSLTYQGADILAKIIKHQAMKRHNEAWQDSLRYRRPELDRMSGIRRISINCNPLIGDQGARLLAEALKDDLWLKALDMQQCGLTDIGAKVLLDVLKFNTCIVVLDIRQNAMTDHDIIRNIMEQLLINSNGQETEYKWVKAEPLRDPAKITPPKQKKKIKTLQNSSGKKTTIKVQIGRKRCKSVGSPITYENDAKGLPWRTAMRAHRVKGYPPDDHSPTRGEGDSPLSSPTNIKINYNDEYDSEESDTMDTSRAVLGNHSDLDKKDSREIKVELEQLRRRLNVEKQARQKAEERVIELTVANNRLKQDVDDFRARQSILDDDKVLDSIEQSFQQFHSFLDLLKDAGLGQLITMAGIDQSSMPFSSKPAPKPSATPPLPKNGSIHNASDISVHAPSVNGSLNGHLADSEEVREHGVIGANVFPDNLLSRQDPTMQEDTGTAILTNQPPSKFDELYNKVLKETEGVLSQGKGDGNVLEGGYTGATDKRSFSGRGDSRPHDDIGALSDHSQGSNRSRGSQRSRGSKGSGGSYTGKPMFLDDIDNLEAADPVPKAAPRSVEQKSESDDIEEDIEEIIEEDF